MAALLGSASVSLFLRHLAKSLPDLSDVWDAVQGLPKAFLDYIARSLTHEMSVTLAIIIGVIGTILYIRHVPTTKVR